MQNGTTGGPSCKWTGGVILKENITLKGEDFEDFNRVCKSNVTFLSLGGTATQILTPKE